MDAGTVYIIIWGTLCFFVGYWTHRWTSRQEQPMSPDAEADLIVAMTEDRAEKLCDDYCKYPEKCLSEIDDPEEAEAELAVKYCMHCPLCMG